MLVWKTVIMLYDVKFYSCLESIPKAAILLTELYKKPRVPVVRKLKILKRIHYSWKVWTVTKCKNVMGSLNVPSFQSERTWVLQIRYASQQVTWLLRTGTVVAIRYVCCFFHPNVPEDEDSCTRDRKSLSPGTKICWASSSMIYSSM
jgi:hypothetical protein